MTIWFDMDGTLVDFYGVQNWLESLRAEHTKPYRVATSLLDMRLLGKELNRLQRLGHKINIISWLSKTGSPSYNVKVTITKCKWLKKHLGAVQFNGIYIVPHGIPKQNYCTSVNDILFDDEQNNRDNWSGKAYSPKDILKVLSNLDKLCYNKDRK